MTFLDQHYQKDPSIVYREIAGESILVPIRPHADDLDSIYTLNETGAYIWSLIDGTRSLAEILDAVVREFEVDYQIAEQDLVDIIRDLESLSAIVRV